MGPGTQIEVGCSTVVIMKSLPITLTGRRKMRCVVEVLNNTALVAAGATRAVLYSLCDGVAQVQGVGN